MVMYQSGRSSNRYLSWTFSFISLFIESDSFVLSQSKLFKWFFTSIVNFLNVSVNIFEDPFFRNWRIWIRNWDTSKDFWKWRWLWWQWYGWRNRGWFGNWYRYINRCTAFSNFLVLCKQLKVNLNSAMDAINDQAAFDQTDVNRNSNFQEFDADMIESPLVII